MKKNIFYIFWSNSLAVEQQKNILIRTFREKFGNESVEQILLDDMEKSLEISTKLASVSLIDEKRMFVFFGGENKKSWKKSETKWSKFLKILESIAENLSENDFLLFHSLWDGEEKLKNWLKKNADLRTYDQQKKQDNPEKYNLSFHIHSWEKFSQLSRPILQKVLKKYENAEKNREKGDSNPLLGHAIFGTIKNLEILEKSGISLNDRIIEQFCHEYEGQKIFDFIDAIMAKNFNKALTMNANFSKNLSSSEAESFFSSLISLLKKNLYIINMKEAGFSQKEIATILPDVHPYMITKCFSSTILPEELRKIFTICNNFVLAYRSGKWMKETILWRFLEIDTVLLSLKNSKKFL